MRALAQRTSRQAVDVILRGAAGLALVALTAACAPWTSVPANGGDRIWDVQARRFVPEQELVARLAGARYRLLGEVHDNPAHHRIRARLITAIAAAGKRPAVVMEQFDLEHDAALRAAQAAGAGAEALATAGAFNRRAWAWPLHKPVLEAALAAHLPVRAGNVPRSVLQDLMKRGTDATLEPAWLARMAASRWADAQQRELDEEIVDSHCHKLPGALVPQLAFAQRMRDAAMANALMTDATDDGAVLIAGNGHVRRNLGVPAYLDPAAREASTAVGIVEAERAGAVARADAEDVARAHPEYDYVWITERTERPDPCAGFEIPPSRAPGAAPPSDAMPLKLNALMEHLPWTRKHSI